MNISQFEMLVEIARVKSFSKAAKLLHMSQPAVSAQIQAIEQFYGTNLFNRSTSGATLNKFGDVVHRYSKEILKLHEQLQKELDSLMDADSQKLIIGASSTFGSYALPCGVWFFKEKYPQVEVKLEIKNSEIIINMLREDQMHLALLEETSIEQLKEFRTKLISNDEIYIIAPPKKPWINKKSITLEELKKAPLIMREKGSGIRQAFEEVLVSKGMTLKDFNVKAEMSSINAIKTTVEAGLGLSVSSGIAVRKEFRSGIIHPLTLEDTPMKVNYLVVYKNEQSLNSAGKKFIRLLGGPGPSIC